jgi:hypothetical protein
VCICWILCALQEKEANEGKSMIGNGILIATVIGVVIGVVIGWAMNAIQPGRLRVPTLFGCAEKRNTCGEALSTVLPTHRAPPHTPSYSLACP